MCLTVVAITTEAVMTIAGTTVPFCSSSSFSCCCLTAVTADAETTIVDATKRERKRGAYLPSFPHYMKMEEDHMADLFGKMDEKIISIPFNDPNYNCYKDISELPAHVFNEMTHFFSVYKNLEEKETVVDEVRNRDEAIEIIKSCINNYITEFCR